MNTLNQARQLQDRTKKFAVRIIKAFSGLQKQEAARVIGRQFLRSGASLAANYRAVCRPPSTADFILKISVVEEEADETLFWLEFLAEIGIIKPARLEDLRAEAKSLVAIFVASRKTAKS